MQEFMQNHPLATMIVCCLPLTVVIVQLCKFAVWAWDSLSAFSFRKRESGLVGTVRPALQTEPKTKGKTMDEKKLDKGTVCVIAIIVFGFLANVAINLWMTCHLFEVLLSD